MRPTFWTMAEDHPDHTALILDDRTEVPAHELRDSANVLVHGLRKAGMHVGDTVAVVLPNCREFLEIYLAALQAGWYLVPINTHLVADEIAYIVRDSDAKMFIGHGRFGATCADAADACGLPEAACLLAGGGTVPGFRPLADAVAGLSSSPPAERTAGLIMNYTSGTTGRPKGVRRSLPGVAPEMLPGRSVLGLFGVEAETDDVHLVGSPLYHTAVLAFAGQSLHLGHTVVLMEKWDAERFLTLVERHRVTTSHMVPTQFQRLLALPEDTRQRYDVSSLRHMVHAAAPCPPTVKRDMINWWGDAIDEYYAATEGGGTLVRAREWLQKPGTVGQPWPGSEIAIFDEGGQPLPPGAIGVVYIAMDAAPFQYHKDSTKTDSSRLGKYFTVGDVGYLDEDGYLFLCDRKADLVISGGVNIYPAEIENVLLEHPAVADVAVFGIPDTEWGESLMAVVEPATHSVASDSLANDILSFSRTRLARFKTPRELRFVRTLPRDPNGKVLKRQLRATYWDNLGRAI